MHAKMVLRYPEGGNMVFHPNEFLELAGLEAKNGTPKRFRIPKDIIVAEFGKAGFVSAKDLDFPPDQHYLEFTLR